MNDRELIIAATKIVGTNFDYFNIETINGDLFHYKVLSKDNKQKIFEIDIKNNTIYPCLESTDKKWLKNFTSQAINRTGGIGVCLGDFSHKSFISFMKKYKMNAPEAFFTIAYHILFPDTFRTKATGLKKIK